MRLTDDRYSREQRRMEVALRMIRLEARTCTIRACTGLTEDRVRKLFNSYIEPNTRGSIRRRRGKSPQQIACFTNTAAAQLSAAVLAGIFTECGLIADCGLRDRPTADVDAERIDTECGALICDAYDFYRELDVPHPFSFEHAWFLLRSLRNEDLALSACRRCGGLALYEQWTAPPANCVLCRARTGKFAND